MKTFSPTSPGRRHRVAIQRLITKNEPEKSLVIGRMGKAGRSHGRVAVRHQGAGVKRNYRIVDFKRRKREIPAKVASLEYDPYRGASIALLHYLDGEKSYILAPQGLKVGDEVAAGEKVNATAGNALPIMNIPLGVPIHNLELQPGRGGQLARGAGVKATIVARGDKYVQVKLPSGEVREILGTCYATIGELSNPDIKNQKLGKAGVKRHRGIRPTVRGSAMNADDHPHGGGEGRSPIGMPAPKTPWGRRTLGVKTRRRKHTDKYIIKDRRAR